MRCMSREGPEACGLMSPTPSATGNPLSASESRQWCTNGIVSMRACWALAENAVTGSLHHARTGNSAPRAPAGAFNAV